LPGRLALPTVPFLVPVPVQTSLGTFAWVGQNTPKPATRIDWTPVTLPPGKVAGIVALAKELVKLAPGSENVMARALTGGIVSFQDRQFLDPAVTLIADERPASITNAVVPITATGTTLDAKARELVAALFAGRPETQRPVLIGTPAVVSELAASDAALTVVGGTFAGVPTFASPEAGALLVAADAAGIVYSDGGGELDTSEEATIEMNDAPDGTTALTSFWQTNLVGFRVERMVWWRAGSGRRTRSRSMRESWPS
jgi:hypothetical protein